ncbi:MAG TPA: DUF6790 family protein [Kaistia sp.]|nr:DUF6790 family protein [Kaistia sp.]
MSDLISGLIRFVLSNFTLSFLVLGLIVSLVAIARLPKPVARAVVIEKLLCWFVFFSIGASFFYNFVMHSLFGKIAASFIGWPDSPFQFEVGVASLGFAVVGFLAAFRSYDLRLAAILGPAIFLLGAAAGHIYQMVTTGNFAPGNAGAIFWTDILIPVIGFGLLAAARRAPVDQ